MKASRLPRKRKKQVKKLVQAKTATKILMSAMVSAQTMAQSAIIAATPVYNYTGATIATKTLSIAQNVASAAKTIQSIMLEPPNSWRDFVR